MDPARLQQGELRSEVMFKEDKKYHIDLKESLVHRERRLSIILVTLAPQLCAVCTLVC